jgi:uncharacterized metal-binding protein YceD (DUF177 family)
MKELRVPGAVARPFEAKMRIIPQDEGFLVTGDFSGSVIVPCGRCAEDFELPLPAGSRASKPRTRTRALKTKAACA